MTVLATDWLAISINLLLFVFVVVCLLMSMIILMQRPKNEGLGAAFGSGTTDQLFGARTTNVLQKATVYLATLFFVLTLALAVMIGKQNAGKRKSLVAQVPAPAPLVVETPPPADAPPLEPDAVTPPVQVPPAPVETPSEPAEAPPAPVETPTEPAEAPPAPVETPTEPAETPAEPETPAEEGSVTPPPAEAEESPADAADSAPPEEP
jgi:preprotein translocase subunit SecG